MENIETVRERALARLEAKASEARARAMDPFWQNGLYNVQRWVECGYNSAINTVQETAPTAGETPADYIDRLAAKVYGSREYGPDADDEGWFSGAIDDACSIIRESKPL
jgi:hypothetical protein